MKAIIIEDESIIAEELQNKIKLAATDVEILAVIPGVPAKTMAVVKCRARSFFYGYTTGRWR